MLDEIVSQTNLYIENMPKTTRKKYGQFFTSKATAVYMSKLLTIPQKAEQISILDTGAGTGILACALIEELLRKTDIKKITLTCYENDSNILKILDSNLSYIMIRSDSRVTYRIIAENYITSQSDDFNYRTDLKIEPKKYDLIIGNPPYKKISKDAPEAKAMSSVCFGAPNLYFLFATMSMFNLKDQGELVYIIPRSWTSGAYFKKFRQYILSEGKIEHIHLFSSRKDVFDKENVLQETIIVKLRKTKITPAEITITTSKSNNDFENLTRLRAPYEEVVVGNESFVFLATNSEEVNVLRMINRWNDTLPSNGLWMRTGLTVDFRNKDLLRNSKSSESIPLFYAQHIKEGVIEFPIAKEFEFISIEKSGLIQPNRNYLFVKRFTSKEEKRRLQSGIYLSSSLPDYKFISTDNKINFVDSRNGCLSNEAVFGLFVIFNSSQYDKYYRILNGSTQVNATEINNMPVPPFDIIVKMGKDLMNRSDFSVENCDSILEGYYV